MPRIKYIIFAIMVLLVAACDRKTSADIEVEELTAEISRIKPESNLNYYRSIAGIIKQQDEVDSLAISGNPGLYFFVKGEKQIDGRFRLDDDYTVGDVIDKNKWSRSPIIDSDRKLVKKWLVFLDKYKIYGFIKGKRDPDEIRIDLTPSIYILFLPKQIDQYYWGEWGGKGNRWKDPRGDVYIKIADDVVVATYRR